MRRSVLIFVSLLFIGVSSALAEPNTKPAAPGLYMEALKLMSAGDDEKALQTMNKAIESNPAWTSYCMRAEIEMNLNKLDAALADAKKSIQLHASDAEPHRMCGRVYTRLRRYDDALKEFDAGLKLKPDNRVIKMDRSRLFELRGEFAKAAEDYTDTIAVTPKKNNFRMYEARGKCYMQTKEYAKAASDFTSALNSSSGRSELYRLRSEAYKRMNKLEQANKDLESAKAMDEDFEPPKNIGEKTKI